MLDVKNKDITCCFFGHDIIRKKDRPEVYNLTMDFLIKLYNTDAIKNARKKELRIYNICEELNAIND